jgi:hypothetical protein
MKVMKEKILYIKKSTRKGKKYMAAIQTNNLKPKLIHFGAKDYQQYRDSTKLKLYSSKNHLDKNRRENYFKRHSGVANKKDALHKEIVKSNGKYNAKILSHKYLW